MQQMDEQLNLIVKGRAYGGWKTVRLSRGIDRIAGGFELTASASWPGQADGFPLKAGDACSVDIDGEPVITGYIDTIERAHDARSHEISLRGRDRTGDIVDCSATPQQWNKQKMEQIALDLLQPFGIPLRVDVDTGARFIREAAEPGESVFDVIERMARMRGVLIYSDGLGGLVIGSRATGVRPDKKKPGAFHELPTDRVETALMLGKNILAAHFESDISERFSQYIVLGHAAGGGLDGDNYNPEDFSRRGEAKDPAIKRHRPLIILAEDQGDASTFETRAIWESTVRLGRSLRATVTTQGWRHASGVWAPNKLVAVSDPLLGIDTELLIVSVNLLMDDGGRRTELQLIDPAAFNRIPIGFDREAAFDKLR